jgi:hypothetical protein
MAKELFKSYAVGYRFYSKQQHIKCIPTVFGELPCFQSKVLGLKIKLVKLCTTIPVGWFVFSHQNQYA